MYCPKCSGENHRRPSERWRSTAFRIPRGMPGAVVCSHCGAVRPIHHATDPGLRVLAKLALVGLGAGAPPLLVAADSGGQGR